MRTLFRLLLASSLVATTMAHDAVTPKPKLLQLGAPQRRLAGHQGDGTVFKLIVPPGAKDLVIKTTGGSGDCDLFAKRNVHPTRLNYDGEPSTERGTKETIRIDNPEAGSWYFLVDGFEDYRGVTLTAHYRINPAAVPVPKLTPAPGVYAGNTHVRLGPPGKGVTFRFTTDGFEPSDVSTLYSTPIALTANTRLRVKAFRKGVAGPEIDGWYFLIPEGEVTTLENAKVLHHRAGAKGATHLYKITVPAGQTRLRIAAEGGKGDVDLLVHRGAIPTAKVFTHRGKWSRQRALVEVTNPAAGEWFISLRGKTAFSGFSIFAAVRPPTPDLIVWAPVLDPQLSVETFTAGQDCEVDEGMIEAGTHRLLRFNTETRNIGGTDLVLPDPEGNPNFEFHPCHGHYHFKGFASYRLLNTEGEEVATGRKVSFCLLDGSRWDQSAPSDGKYDCSTQGIQVGWADTYDAGLPGQWINVTGVPDGIYTLEVTMNPEEILEEADYTNNSATIQVVIGPETGE